METEKNALNLEQAVYELIRFLMKWGMWNKSFIYCGGKIYTDAGSANLFENDKGVLYYGGEKETGFRGLEDIVVFTDPDGPEIWDVEADEDACRRSKPLIVLENAEAICLFLYRECILCYKKMSAWAKRFVLTNTWLGERILENMRREMGAPKDNHWIIQDYDSFEEWAETQDINGEPAEDLFPTGYQLDLEHPEIYDGWCGEDEKGRFIHLDDDPLYFGVGGAVPDRIEAEFDDLMKKHGLVFIVDHGERLLIYSRDSHERPPA